MSIFRKRRDPISDQVKFIRNFWKNFPLKVVPLSVIQKFIDEVIGFDPKSFLAEAQHRDCYAIINQRFATILSSEATTEEKKQKMQKAVQEILVCLNISVINDQR